MARVVAVCSAKGGVGKTTMAVSLAALFAETLRVLLVDADPQDAGSAEWWIGDASTWQLDLVKETDPELLADLKFLPQYDIVIVDTPPRLDSLALRAVASTAHLVICAAPPDGAEIVAALQTMASFPDHTDARILLTMVDSRSINEAREALAALSSAGIPTLHTFVRLYKAYRRARSANAPITRGSGEKITEAIADCRHVTAEIASLLAGQLAPAITAKAG